MSEEWLSVDELAKRDNINSKEYYTFQIQSEKDKNYTNIIPIGKYSEIPIRQIHEMPFVNDKSCNCNILSFLVSHEEIEAENLLKMIGCIITKNGKILASVDFMFKPSQKIKLEDVLIKDIKDVKNIEGTFEIILNNNKQKQVMESFDTYPGREESIYLLVKALNNIKIHTNI